MISLTLNDVACAVGGELVGKNESFYGVSTDSRTLERGELFVALKGERFDGHDSLAEAQRRGAVGAIVERSEATTLPLICAKDTRKALGNLANLWRRRHSIPVIGITGSNGKTTTKEMTAAILRQRCPVLATSGNLNNDVGLPQTLFGLQAQHGAAVIEMGANRPHDIAELAKIAEPTIGVVTMCGPAHLEGFGSLEGVAAAKGQIYTALKPAGTAIINADDPFAAYWTDCSRHAAQRSFGINSRADFAAEDIVNLGIGRGLRFKLRSALGSIEIALCFEGRHNVYNALAAAAAAAAAGATLEDIQRGLASARPIHGRLELTYSACGAMLIDDTYNANPASLMAAMEVLRTSPGEHWLVLGDMAELGEAEIAVHRAAGERAREDGIDRLFGIGVLAREAARAFGAGAAHYTDPDELISDLRDCLHSGVTLLLKGSRKMQLDKVVAALVAHGNSPC